MSLFTRVTPTRLGTFFALAALVGCGNYGVTPSAADLARGGPVTAQLLSENDYEQMPIGTIGPFPDGFVCWEKARGVPPFGIDVVRACLRDGATPKIFGLKTHSGEGWQRYFADGTQRRWIVGE